MKKAASITSEVFNKFFKERVMEIVDADEVRKEGGSFQCIGEAFLSPAQLVLLFITFEVGNCYLLQNKSICTVVY